MYRICPPPPASGAHPGPGALGPLRPVEQQTADLLGEVLSRAMSVGVLWSPWRCRLILDLASRAAHRQARVYLVGPADLGQQLDERAWLRDHGGRLLSRRGVSCGADLLLLNSGVQRTALLFLHRPARSFWVWLSDRQAEAAADWFSHLFWHRSTEEGRVSPGGYRFQRCGAPPFQVPDLPPEAPLWLTQGPLPEVTPPGALVHDPAVGRDLGLPTFAVSKISGHIDAPSTSRGGWSLRLRLDPLQARQLYAAAMLVLRR